jgi:magnesium transporter
MFSKLIIPEIEEIIDKKDFTAIKEIIKELEAPDIAELLSELDENKQVIFLRFMPTSLAADVFESFDTDTQIGLLEKLSQPELASILNEMSDDDRTELLEEVPSTISKKLINLLTKEEREIAVNLLGYPEGSVGRLITTNFVAVSKDMKIEDVFNHIRTYGRDAETIETIYVVDDKDRLVDDISIEELIFAEADKRVSEIMDETFVSLNVWDDQEKAVDTFKKYDLYLIPVTDYSGVLLGIVTVDDVIDVAEEEATEDIQKLGGTETLDEPYSTISVMRMIRKRAIWLSMLFIGEMFTASAMAYFQNEISKAVVLALFVPLIISSGGNSGSQAATLVIRAMALQEITIKDWLFVLRREIFSGLILGLILSIIGFIRIIIWQSSWNVYGEHWLLIGITVSLSLIGVVTWGTLMGGMLPILLKKIGLDPATSSAPFVATLVDVVGIVIYFSIALFVLRGIYL